jgi:hypothetical protein
MRPILIASLLLLAACRTFPKPEDVRDFHWRDAVAASASAVPQSDASVTHAPSAGVTILFNNLRVDLQPSPADLSAIAAAGSILPLEPGRPVPTPIRCQVRGNAVVPTGSNAIVFAEIGTESKVFEFAGHDGNFIRDIGMTVTGGASRPFPVTLLIRASRATAQTAVRVEVDSVDCAVDFGPRAP